MRLSQRRLYQKYKACRKKWLESKSTDFDDELGELFDEIEDYLDLPMGN